MSFNKAEDSLLEKLIEAIKDLYVDVKIKYKSDNEKEFKNNELEKIKEINVFKLIDYIKESINIYINYKLDEARNSFNETNCKEKVFTNNDEEVYEKMIKKLEADIRNHIKVEYELKLQNEYLESKLEEYENTLVEIEKLQIKIDQYERKLGNPEFQEINKKENEIIILRAENSNLKKTIIIIEKNMENLQQKFSELKKNKEKIIIKNQEKIDKLSKKLKKLEESLYVDNLTNSTDEKREKISVNKEKSSTIVAHTTRKNSGNNVLNLFYSDGKGKLTERKYSVNELIKLSDNLNQREFIDNFICKESAFEKDNKNCEESRTKNKILKQRAYSNIFEKINNNGRPIHQNEKAKIKQSSDISNFKRSASVNDFNVKNDNSNCTHNLNKILNSNSSNSSNTNHLSKSDLKDQNEKKKNSIWYDSKSNNSNVNKSIGSQLYKKNNFNDNSLNINNININSKSKEMIKTPVSSNSNNSININNNNIVINNKYQSDSTKPITNLNMIFKFKTILNDKINSKNNKIIKVDAKKVIRNKSINQKTNQNKVINNEINRLYLGNVNLNETNFKSKQSNLNLIDKKESYFDNKNTFNNNKNILSMKDEATINYQSKKIINMNSTLKSKYSTSKSKVKSSKINEYNNNFDALKYSINQLKDFLNPQNQTNPKIKISNSKSKGKVSNIGII